MNILFLSHYFPPEVNAPASRTHEHCRAWAAAGHRVTVVTCVPNHPRGVVYEGYRNKFWQIEQIDGIEIIRIWTFLAANEGFVPRTLNYISYFVSILLALPRLPTPDIIVSRSPQFFCGLAGYLVKAWSRAPWVLEIRDLWPDSIVSVGAMRRGFLVTLLQQLERFAYARADAIVAVSPAFVLHIAERCGERSKIAVIANGVDFTQFDPDRALPSPRLASSAFTAAYVGTIGMAHGLDTVLDAACLLRDERNIRLLLIGDGADRARLIERKTALGLDNVEVHGQLAKAEVPNVWANADAALVLLRDEALFRTVLPSKMFEAMAMRCPVILGVEGAARTVLEAAGAGVPIRPQDPKQLATAILELRNDKARRKLMGERGRSYAVAHCDRAKLAMTYLALLQSTVASRREQARTSPPALQASTPGP